MDAVWSIPRSVPTAHDPPLPDLRTRIRNHPRPAVRLRPRGDVAGAGRRRTRCRNAGRGNRSGGGDARDGACGIGGQAFLLRETGFETAEALSADLAEKTGLAEAVISAHLKG